MNRDIRVRKSWGDMNPVTRVHSKEGKTGRNPKFNKAKRKDWKRSLTW